MAHWLPLLLLPFAAADISTLDSMRLHLRETLAQHATAEGDYAQRKLLGTRLPALRQLKRVHLAPSGIAGAGVGVYASEPIAAGELITCCA
jgi:hypothetical protein